MKKEYSNQYQLDVLNKSLEKVQAQFNSQYETEFEYLEMSLKETKRLLEETRRELIATKSKLEQKTRELERAQLKERPRDPEFTEYNKGMIEIKEWVTKHKDMIQAAAENPNRANDLWQYYSESEQVVGKDGKVQAYNNVQVDFAGIEKKLYAQARRLYSENKVKGLWDFLENKVFRTDLFKNNEQRNTEYLLTRLRDERPDIYMKIIETTNMDPLTLQWDYNKISKDHQVFSYNNIHLYVNTVKVSDGETPLYEFNLEVQ